MPKLKKILNYVLFFLTPLFITAVVMRNYQITTFKAWMLNYYMYLTLLFVLLTLSDSMWLSAAVMTMLGAVVYVFNYEIALFRGAPIVPTDIFSAGTALNVSANYKPVFNVEILLSVVGALLWIGLLFAMRQKRTKKRLLWGCITLAMVLACHFGIGTYFEVNDPKTWKYEKYDTALSNKRFGVLPTFWMNSKEMSIDKPEGYSKERAEEILSEYTAGYATYDDTAVQPNVIAVMNESFADLSAVYELDTSEEILPNYHALQQNAIKGNLLTSIYGGNTCISEFEFLTGMTGGIFSEDTIQYTQCVTKPVNSLADDFKSQGYKTIGMHPFWKNSWRRDAVYPLLGFDEAIFAENFDKSVEKGSNLLGKPQFGDYEYIRGYLSDSECYNKIERIFEDKTDNSDNERLFLFNVTMQNHGGYDYNKDDFTATMTATSDVTDTDKNRDKLNQYLTLARESDKALGELIDYFKNYDEPTVIVFFGDHQPNLNFTKNNRDEFDFLNKNAKYVVPYFIWTNYDIEAKNVDLTSPAYLSLIMKQVCNMPLTRFDAMREELMKKYPVLNARFAIDSDGNRIDVEDIDDELYDNYKIVEYGMTYNEVTP